MPETLICTKCGELRLPGQPCQPCKNKLPRKKRVYLPGTEAIIKQNKIKQKEKARKAFNAYRVNFQRNRPSRYGRCILLEAWLLEDITSCFQRDAWNRWVLIPEKAGGDLQQCVARALYLLSLLATVRRQQPAEVVTKAQEHWALIKEQSE